MNLEGKLAIVTGSRRGIGRALVDILLEKGARVAGWSRSATEIDDSNFFWVETDVTSLIDVEESYARTLAHFNTENVDILINNAGLGIFKYFEKLEPADWERMLNTNVRGVLNCCRQVVGSMRKGGSGTIVNLSSTAGMVGIPEATVYCATKYAVRGFSDALRRELRKYGVRVMTVYPGSVNTDFFEEYDSMTPDDTMMDPKDLAETIIHNIELPDNVAVNDLVIRPLRDGY